MRIAFLGNFSQNHCTEVDYKKTFEDLGHTVVPLQEGQATGAECIAAGVASDLFCWVNTHGWSTPGSIPMEEVLSIFRARKILSFGMHLDRYWGLELGDGREGRIGKTAWWKMDHIFTADGGNDEKFKARGVNHHWLPPAILKASCYIGHVREEKKCDVAWVGAKGYHPEYPFREQLVTWLEKEASRRWKVRIWGPEPYGGVRGSALNDIYASAKIVVGDSCFAGAPRYWSDRIPETQGRRGFLLHPFSVGMKMPLKTYEARNLDSLAATIEYWLKPEMDEHRKEMAQGAFDWTRTCDTYHNRVAEMFSVMGLE